MHIYLVEIENDARHVIARHLRDLGHQVSLLPAPEDLMEPLAADPEPADLIIVDLPPAQAGLTGEALRSVHRRNPTIPVVLRADVNQTDLEQTEQAIAHLGRLIQRTFRDADMAGWVDGTDCGVLLVNAGAGQTDIALRRLQQNIVAHNAQAGNGQQLKVRVGVAHFDPDQPRTFEELVAQADTG